ncbi:MAG TPA: ATP synthase F1 subunit delta [Actinomycetota bacterium]|nr:ATP synthase F1 subunit delta [Actinomycetota bacterium]
MSISRAAARVYARALFEIGVGGGDVAQVSDELHAVQAAIDGLTPELSGFFLMPQLRREDKRQVVKVAFGPKVGRTVIGLLDVLIDKRREALLDTIVAEYDDLVDEHEGRVQAQVTSARTLDADLAEALRSAIEQRTQRRVVLHQRVDPSLLGGVRVSVGDLVLDGTLRRGLADLRRTLASTSTS